MKYDKGRILDNILTFLVMVFGIVALSLYFLKGNFF